LALLALLAASVCRAETQTLADGQVIRGHFTQERHLQGFANPVKSEGHFVLAAGTGLLWVTEQPFAVTTAITANGLTQSVGGKQTAKFDAQRLPFLTRIYGMMSGALGGRWDALKADFSVRTDGPHIVLTPLRADTTGAAIAKISLVVTHFVDEVEIERPNGDSDHVVFTGQTLSSGPLSAEESGALGPSHP
jgi:hypothetical protein